MVSKLDDGGLFLGCFIHCKTVYMPAAGRECIDTARVSEAGKHKLGDEQSELQVHAGRGEGGGLWSSERSSRAGHLR